MYKAVQQLLLYISQFLLHLSPSSQDYNNVIWLYIEQFLVHVGIHSPVQVRTNVHIGWVREGHVGTWHQPPPQQYTYVSYALIFIFILVLIFKQGASGCFHSFLLHFPPLSAIFRGMSAGMKAPHIISMAALPAPLNHVGHGCVIA